MTKVKICGLRRPEDAAAANRCLPDYAGFVFANKSRRRIDLETAKRLREKLDRRILTVGVFVGQPEEEIAGLCRAGVIDFIQLHGGECTEYAQRLQALTQRPVIRAVAVADHIPELPAGPELLLFDTATPGQGGSGKTFDWSLLGPVRRDYFLAGGLHSGNVAEAIRQLKPYAVDVSSGVETDGWKDADKMMEFTDMVRRSGQ